MNLTGWLFVPLAPSLLVTRLMTLVTLIALSLKILGVIRVLALLGFLVLMTVLILLLVLLVLGFVHGETSFHFGRRFGCGNIAGKITESLF